MLDRTIVDIPFECLENVKYLFARHAQLNLENMREKQKKYYERTKKIVENNIKIKGIYISVKLSKVDSGGVFLENGDKLEGKILEKVMHKPEEILLFATTLQGYEEIERKYNDMLDKFFLDAWGSAMVSSGYKWMLKNIKKTILIEEGKYFGNAWSPGQHTIDMKNQEVIFKILKPIDIGLTLTESLLMIPRKSTSGFLSISSEEDKRNIVPCDFCELKKTCAAAYHTEDDISDALAEKI